MLREGLRGKQTVWHAAQGVGTKGMGLENVTFTTSSVCVQQSGRVPVDCCVNKVPKAFRVQFMQNGLREPRAQTSMGLCCWSGWGDRQAVRGLHQRGISC